MSSKTKVLKAEPLRRRARFSGIPVVVKENERVIRQTSPVNGREALIEIFRPLGSLPNVIRLNVDAIQVGVWTSLLHEPGALSSPDATFDNGSRLEPLHDKPEQKHMRGMHASRIVLERPPGIQCRELLQSRNHVLARPLRRPY